jgi:hypothetical protein
MSQEKKAMTPLGVKRRFNKMMRAVDALTRELGELENMVPAPSPEELRAMMAPTGAPLPIEAHLLASLRLVALKLESAWLIATDNAKEWCPRDSHRLQQCLTTIVESRAREKLRAFMSGISLDATGEPWAENLEFLLWAALKGEDDFTRFQLCAAQKSELCRLSESAAGWWLFRQEWQLLIWLKAGAWEREYAEWKRAQATVKAPAQLPHAMACVSWTGANGVKSLL